MALTRRAAASKSSEIITLKTSYMEKVNKLMPPGVVLQHARDRSRSRSVPKSNKRPRKRQRAYQGDSVQLSETSKWIDKNWGLKVGGEAARRCYEIIKNLKKHSLSGPFLQPVDPVAFNLPDYLEIIQDPLDLSTVERNLKVGLYQNSQQFAVDIRRIWLNSFTYNASDTDMFYITLELATYFERQFSEVQNLEFLPGSELKTFEREQSDLEDYLSKPMPLSEKKVLAASLKKLNKSQLLKAYQLVTGKKNIPNSFQVNLSKLTTRKLRELEKFVKLTHQAALHGSRQRILAPYKRMMQYEEGLPEKAQKT